MYFIMLAKCLPAKPDDRQAPGRARQIQRNLAAGPIVQLREGGQCAGSPRQAAGRKLSRRCSDAIPPKAIRFHRTNFGANKSGPPKADNPHKLVSALN